MRATWELIECNQEPMGSIGETSRSSIRMVAAQNSEQMGSFNIWAHGFEQMGSPKLSQSQPSEPPKSACLSLIEPSQAINGEKLAQIATSQLVALVLGTGCNASPALTTTNQFSVRFSGRVPASCIHQRNKNQTFGHQKNVDGLAWKTSFSRDHKTATCLIYWSLQYWHCLSKHKLTNLDS